MADMKPWEKPCPRCWVTAAPSCEACHGTGVAPMTTDEMLEALYAINPSGSLGWGEGGWSVWMGRYFTASDTPAEALRAALEALPPRR